MGFDGVIELRRDRVLMAWGGRRSGWLDEAIPPGHEDVEARGQWLGSLIAERGVSLKRAMVVLPPRETMLLRLELKVPAQVDEVDLHEITRLRLGSELTIDSATCLLDVVPIAGNEYAVSAVPGETVDRLRRVLKAAGIRVSGLTTRAACLAEIAKDRGADLVVAAGEREIELLMLVDGVPVLARQLDRNGDLVAAVDRVVSEIHRMATGTKLLSGRGELASAVVIGDSEIVNALEQRIGEELSVDVLEKLPTPTGGSIRVQPVQALVDSDREPVFRLRHLESATGLRSRGVRIGVGLGLLALIVVMMGGVLAGRVRGSLERQVSSLSHELTKLQRENRRLMRDQARLEHVSRWAGDEPRWSEHLMHLRGDVPARGVVFDRISGNLKRAISFEPKRTGSGRRYIGGAWTDAQQLTIDIHGRVVERGLVPKFREAVLSDPVYDIESVGADMPDRFVFRITTEQSGDSVVDGGGAG
ncbi:MAG TPA: hypothetical protein ENJ00_00300 [Phycisphaerales bacterium]|nr:hypothetical protein [Phycisphaerales bacterium]